MGTIGYAKILSVLKGEKPGWNRKFLRQLERLRRVLPDELLGCVELGEGSPVPPGLTLQQFQESMWAIRKGPHQPRHLRDQIQELDAACFMYLAPTPRPEHAPEFGRICAYCWRNEEGRMATHNHPYGMCHLHRVPADPGSDKSYLGEANVSPADPERRQRNVARRAVRHSDALLRLDVPDLFHGHVGHPLRRYPVHDKSRNRSVTKENWCGWLQQEYPLFHSAIQLIDRTEVLACPVQTIRFLENRQLTASEQDLYAGRSKEIVHFAEHPLAYDLIMGSIWEVPVSRCSAWLNLERIHSSKKGREPDYEGLLLPGSLGRL